MMRRTVTALTLGILIGGILMAALPSLAGNGDALRLGQKNQAGLTTKVVAKDSFVFKTTVAGTPAAKFKVVSGAPFAVDSDTKVKHLNADEVDGRSARELRSGWAWKSHDTLADDANWTSTTNVTVPGGGGVILLTGTVDFYNDAVSSDSIDCYFEVDGNYIEASFMRVHAGASEWGICHSTAAYATTAGTHTVTFNAMDMVPANIHPDDGFWWAVVLPN
jgi:hypothetical protein